MVKYEIIGKNDYLLNPIETILHNRGIEDVNAFLNVNENIVNDWRLLNNIEDAVDCLLKHIKNNNKIFVQYDSDIDGICSSTILINYLTKVFPQVNIQWRIHEGKQHGVLVDEVPNDVQLVIIPDAGSNQYKEHQQLKERGIDVIVLDHHECEKESESAIVVNNQLSQNYPNKSLSGAAIVYKFLKALDNKLNINHADHYMDLVSVGLIGDMMNSRELETRYYMLKGLTQIKNKFLKALYKKQEFSTKGIVNIINTQFYIVPLANASVRAGNLQEKLQMIRAFLETDEQIYNPKKKEHVSIYEDTARVLTNIRSRQNRLRDKGAEAIEERIIEKGLDQNKFLIVNVTDILDKNLTGLVANQLAREYKRPVLLLRYNEKSNEFNGSMRGYDKGVIKDTREFLLNTGVFNFVEGHSNAAGVGINVDKLLEANEIINNKLKDVEIDTEVYDVDFIISGNQLNENIIKDIHNLRDMWGFMVEEPLLAFKDLEISKDDIQLMGKTKNTLKFKFRSTEFIKFRYSEEEFEEQFNKDGTYIVDIIGRAGVNEYNGTVTPQVIIEDFEVKEIKKKTFVF